MIFRILFLIIAFLVLNKFLIAENFKIGLLCKNKVLSKILKEKLEKNFILVDNIKNANIVICGDEKYIKECCKLNKKVIAIDFNYYNITDLIDNHIIAYFPSFITLKVLKTFLKSLKKLKRFKFCALTHYQNIKQDNNINIFYVKKIGDVPFVLNKALKNCDIFLTIPDNIVFNYFSTRFILKRIILNGKFFIGFEKNMLDLGALYTFEINYDKYSEKIIKFLKNFSKIKKSKIILPEINDFKILKNENMLYQLK